MRFTYPYHLHSEKSFFIMSFLHDTTCIANLVLQRRAGIFVRDFLDPVVKVSDGISGSGETTMEQIFSFFYYHAIP